MILMMRFVITRTLVMWIVNQKVCVPPVLFWDAGGFVVSLEEEQRTLGVGSA